MTATLPTTTDNAPEPKPVHPQALSAISDTPTHPQNDPQDVHARAPDDEPSA